MKRGKYPINREFLSLSLYTPSLNPKVIARFNQLAGPPKALFKDPSLNVRTVKIPTNATTTLIMEELRIEYMKRKFRG